MLRRIVGMLVSVALLSYSLLAPLEATTPAAAQEREAVAQAPEGVEVLARGPVHEAFAEPVLFDARPGLVVNQEPPESIEELPPDQRPAGENVAWIPGYWAWDDESGNFLWVSGIWRIMPPGRQWVPGYWAETNDGYQWISGYWAGSDTREIQYLPEPPASLETGPNVPAPTAEYSWLPGSWIWHDQDYAWQPGYWARANPNWIWTPAYYSWTPRGYLFVDGFWDFPVLRRGILFAPVNFAAAVYARPGFQYSPSIVINVNLFTAHLFTRPLYGHYYFGDFYAAGFRDQGFYPWFAFHSRRGGFDPIFAHERWSNMRQDRNWEQRIERDFDHRRTHEEDRPPHTMAAVAALAKDRSEPDSHLQVAQTLAVAAKNPEGALRFQPLKSDERQAIAKKRAQILEFGGERRRLESPSAEQPQKGRPEKPAQTKVALPKSPIGAPAEPSDVDPGQRSPGKIKTLPDVKSDLQRPPAKPEPAPGTKEVPKPLPKAQPEKPSRLDPVPPGKTDPTPLPKGKTPPAPKVDQPSQPEPKPAPKGEPPKPQPKVTPPKPAPKVEPPRGESPKPAPKVEPPRGESPKPLPRVEPPKPQPKGEPPKPAPKVEPPRVEPPKAAPRVEPPRQAPRVEPKPQAPPPRVEPKPPPRVEPKPQPKVEPPRPQPQPPKANPQPQPPKANPQPQPPKGNPGGPPPGGPPKKEEKPKDGKKKD